MTNLISVFLFCFRSKRVNEKNRREQEGSHIDELAKLRNISGHTRDVNVGVVKPDRTAILTGALDEIQRINGYNAVQQGDVSSTNSRPNYQGHDVIAPLVVDAIDAFVFIVNKDGNVTDVTDGVSKCIHYMKDEVIGQSIYNFIHHGDHFRFSSRLNPSIASWGNSDAPGQQNRSKPLMCRFLVKPDDQDETMEKKQQRVSKYEYIVITSKLISQGGDPDSADAGPALLCFAKRMPQEQKIFGEYFTIRFSTNQIVLDIDTGNTSPWIQSFVKKVI